MATNQPSENEPVLGTPWAEIVDLYAKDVDRSLIRDNLRLTYLERLGRLQLNVRSANRLRGAGLRAAKKQG